MNKQEKKSEKKQEESTNQVEQKKLSVNPTLNGLMNLLKISEEEADELQMILSGITEDEDNSKDE